VFPPPHLQRLPYSNTFARSSHSIRPPTDAPSVCYIPYTIGDSNIVQRPTLSSPKLTRLFLF